MLDLDEAILAEIFGPLVLQLPVEALHRVLSVANEFHCMPTDVGSGRILVNTALIVIEVFHDLQAHEHRPIVDQLALYLVVIHGKLQRARLTVILVILVSCAVGAFKAADGLVFDVGDASVWHRALRHQVVYRCEQVAAHAAIILVVTVDHFLWGKAHVYGTA